MLKNIQQKYSDESSLVSVTYVYVCNKMGKVGESVYINKTIEIDIYV